MKNNNSGGYVAILVVLISVAIISFLMVQQYERIGAREKQIKSGALNDNSSDTSVTPPIKPIDGALKAKLMLEAQDRALLNE